MNNLKKLTLVIPTYERQRFAIRAMRYWSSLGPEVYVVDGSKMPLRNEDLRGLNDNIHYHHIKEGLYSRLAHVLPHIKTKYTSLIGDDEFFLPSGLNIAIDFLDSNPEFVSCSGQCIRFIKRANNIFWQKDYNRLKGYSVLNADPMERMIYHMSHYTPSTIYAVSRTEDWKSVMALVTTKEYPVYAIGELQFEMAMSYRGKSIAINNILWIRSSENQGIRGTDLSLDPQKRFDFWWDSSENQQEKEDMINLMADHLMPHADNQMIKESLKQAMNQYRRSISKNKYNINKVFFMRVINYLKLKSKKLIFPNTFEPSGWFRLNNIHYEFEVDVSKVAQDDLKEILNILLKFHCHKSE
jgi:glycosyltransferase domain-containing protein